MLEVKLSVVGVLADKKFFYKIIFLFFFCCLNFIFVRAEDEKENNKQDIEVSSLVEPLSLSESVSEFSSEPKPESTPDLKLESTPELTSEITTQTIPEISPSSVLKSDLNPVPNFSPIPEPSPMLDSSLKSDLNLFSDSSSIPSPGPISTLILTPTPTPVSSNLPLNSPFQMSNSSPENEKNPETENSRKETGGAEKFIFSELMYYFKNQEGKTDKKGQWIEFFNHNQKEIELKNTGKYGDKFKYNLRICDRWEEEKKECKKDYQVYYEKEELKIDGEEIFILARDKSIFKRNYPEYEGKILESSFDLSSILKPNFLGLFIEKEKTEIFLDRLEYYSSWGGKGNNKTIERKDYDRENNEDNWIESFNIGGTPGKKYEKIEIDYPDKIYINEVLPDPEGSDAEGEFIELVNLSNEEINLAGWLLKDKIGEEYIFSSSDEIEAEGFLVINYKQSGISINNSDEEIFLFNPNGEEVHKIEYSKTKMGFSYARKNNGDYSWTNILTPGKENQFLEDKIFPSDIYFNEIFSNAEGVDKDNEWVEFFNSGRDEVDLNGWMIESSSGRKLIISDFKIAGGDYAVFYFKNTTFVIKNNQEKLILINPKEEKVDEVFIKENALVNSSYNKTIQNQWRWSRFLTPGRKNQLNNSPQINIKKLKKIYQNVTIHFDASKTFDLDGDELKFKWDFGDGHKSYKKETSHIYRKIGDYQVKLFVNDGSEEVTEEFFVEVRDFPHYKVRIIEFMPNPKGQDTEGEYVILKNYSRHRINLDGWKIATGKDKKSLSNHLINKKLIIEPGGKKKVKRKHCALALLNSKGVVALKYPNDNLADLINYEKDKIEEDERYFIGENSDWDWQVVESSVGDEEKEAIVDINLSRSPDLFWENGGMEEVEVLGESFQDLISKIFHNEQRLISENLSKIKFDNWRGENKIWLGLGGCP